jgi:hypothetical protein
MSYELSAMSYEVPERSEWDQLSATTYQLFSKPLSSIKKPLLHQKSGL